MHIACKADLVSPPRTHRRASVAQWLAWLQLCVLRSGERRRLRELTDRELKDIGLSRADVERECRRWPWDGPGWRP
jgi:uncharacterized protein YjiS (DUF1127 family)